MLSTCISTSPLVLYVYETTSKLKIGSLLTSESNSIISFTASNIFPKGTLKVFENLFSLIELSPLIIVIG